jgi:hypothetical protein
MQLKGPLTKETLKDLDKVRLSASYHKIPRVWVLAADKSAARVFRRDGKHLALLGEMAPKNDVFGIEGGDVFDIDVLFEPNIPENRLAHSKIISTPQICKKRKKEWKALQELLAQSASKHGWVLPPDCEEGTKRDPGKAHWSIRLIQTNVARLESICCRGIGWLKAHL